jgi:hypothetical protein
MSTGKNTERGSSRLREKILFELPKRKKEFYVDVEFIFFVAFVLGFNNKCCWVCLFVFVITCL